jgi:phospholipase/carboxylesterase
MNLLHTIYEPAGSGPHPAIIAIHGWGANALDLLGLSPYLGTDFMVVCPQGPLELAAGASVGYGWFPISPGQPPDPAEFTRGVEALREFVREAVRRYPIDTRKLVVLGFSQGGVMAYSLALEEPERFAALVCLSSWLPPPVAERLAPADRTRLPTLVHHGAADPMIPVERGRESVEILRRLAVPVTYREFDMGHEINAPSLTDLSHWLRDKILSPIIRP